MHSLVQEWDFSKDIKIAEDMFIQKHNFIAINNLTCESIEDAVDIVRLQKHYTVTYGDESNKLSSIEEAIFLAIRRHDSVDIDYWNGSGFKSANVIYPYVSEDKINEILDGTFREIIILASPHNRLSRDITDRVGKLTSSNYKIILTIEDNLFRAAKSAARYINRNKISYIEVFR